MSGQVVYNGHPLYEYTGDSAAGQANGEGIMGKWYAATPTLATGAGPGTTAPSQPVEPVEPVDRSEEAARRRLRRVLILSDGRARIGAELLPSSGWC